MFFNNLQNNAVLTMDYGEIIGLYEFARQTTVLYRLSFVLQYSLKLVIYKPENSINTYLSFSSKKTVTSNNLY